MIRCTVCEGWGHVRNIFGDIEAGCEVCNGSGQTTAEKLEAYRLELAEIEAESGMSARCQECNAAAGECACAA